MFWQAHPEHPRFATEKRVPLKNQYRLNKLQNTIIVILERGILTKNTNKKYSHLISEDIQVFCTIGIHFFQNFVQLLC